MATRQAQQALVPGRLVLVSDPVTGMSALSIVLGEPQGYTAPSRTASATGAVILLFYRKMVTCVYGTGGSQTGQPLDLRALGS